MLQSDSKFVQHVSKIYEKEKLLSKLLIGLVISNLILALLIAASYLGDATVIMEKEGEFLSFKGEKRRVVITASEIKKVAENFIKRRYEWEKFNLDETVNNLSSIVTPGLKAKISDELGKEMESFKSISQYIGKINLSINENGAVIGSFDKILRLTARPKDGSDQLASIPEKIPLLSETQIQLVIVKGTPSADNPIGLFVNSVVEYAAR